MDYLRLPHHLQITICPENSNKVEEKFYTDGYTNHMNQNVGNQETFQKMSLAEMRLPGWMTGITIKERIRTATSASNGIR